MYETMCMNVMGLTFVLKELEEKYNEKQNTEVVVYVQILSVC